MSLYNHFIKRFDKLVHMSLLNLFTPLYFPPLHLKAFAQIYLPIRYPWTNDKTLVAIQNIMVWIYLLSILFGLAWYYFYLPLNYWKRRGVPSVKALPIVGSLWPALSQKTTVGLLLQEFYNAPEAKGKPFIGFNAYHSPALLIRDPELIKQIIIKDFNNFRDRLSYTCAHVDPVGSRSLFFVKGQKWKPLRVALTPIFTTKRIRDMFKLVEDCGKNITNYYLENFDGKVDDIRDGIMRCTSDVIVSCAFGVDSNCISNPDSKFRVLGQDIFNYSRFRTLQIQSVFFGPHYLTNILRSGFFPRPVQDYMRSVFWEIIHEREKSGIKRSDLVDLLIELRKENDVELQKHMDLLGDDLVAQSTMFFAAGFDTTGSMLIFIIYELARNPEIQEKLRDEILSVIPKYGEFKYEALADMIYLDQVCKEALRIYPPLPFLDRLVMQDYQIPGTNVTLEKGTTVYIPLSGLHFDPNYFPDPYKFDPERFSPEAKTGRAPPYTFLPFGDGPRNCIGSRFAYMVIKSILVHLISKIEFKLDPNSKPLQLNKCSILTQSDGPLNIYMNKINP